MVRVVVLGSVNVDHVYGVHAVAGLDAVSHPAVSYRRCLGGKGLNQAHALLQASQNMHMDVAFVGQVADDEDGRFVREELARRHPELLRHLHTLSSKDVSTGHVIIQHPVCEGHPVSFLWAGANLYLSRAIISSALQNADVVVLQNECNELAYVVQECSKRHIRVLLNPAPVIPALEILQCPIEWLVINQSELQMLRQILSSTDAIQPKRIRKNDDDEDMILEELMGRLPVQAIILTMGAEGAMAAFRHKDAIRTVRVPARRPTGGVVVDPVGAGDCFLGYFLASFLSQANNEATELVYKTALQAAVVAASLKVERAGAFDGIPTAIEVEAEMR